MLKTKPFLTVRSSSMVTIDDDRTVENVFVFNVLLIFSLYHIMYIAKFVGHFRIFDRTMRDDRQ